MVRAVPPPATVVGKVLVIIPLKKNMNSPHPKPYRLRSGCVVPEKYSKMLASKNHREENSPCPWIWCWVPFLPFGLSGNTYKPKSRTNMKMKTAICLSCNYFYYHYCLYFCRICVSFKKCIEIILNYFKIFTYIFYCIRLNQMFFSVRRELSYAFLSLFSLIGFPLSLLETTERD